MTTTVSKTIKDGDRTATSELVNLSIEESSGVDAGDNPEAHVAMLKAKHEAEQRAQQGANVGVFGGIIGKLKKWAGVDVAKGKDAEKDYGGTPMTVGQLMAVQTFKEQFWKLRMAFVESMYSIMENSPADKMGELMAQSAAEFSAEATKLSQGLRKDKRAELAGIIEQMAGSLADPVLPQSKRAALVGAIEKLEGFEFVTDEHAGDGGAGDDVTNNKENTMSTAIKNVVTTTPAAEPSEFEKKMTAGLEAMQKSVDDANKRAEKAEKANADLSETVKALQARESTSSYMAKARDLNVPGRTVDEVAEALRTAYGVDEKTGKMVEATLAGTAKLGNHAIAILKAQHGSTVTGGGPLPVDDTTPHGKLMKIASELRKANPALSEAAAYVKAMESNAKLGARAIRSSH